MHLVCKYSCYSFRYFWYCHCTAIPTCSCNFQVLIILLLLFFVNLFRMLSTKSSERAACSLSTILRLERWLVEWMLGMWSLPISRTSMVQGLAVWWQANFIDNKRRCVRSSKAFLFSVNIANASWDKHSNTYTSASQCQSSMSTSLANQSWTR